MSTVSGNWISLDLGNNRYAIYTHLQPGSIKVKVGEKVRAGQMIAKIGNSGDSATPSLGFHVGDASTPLGCEGLPFVFDAFEVSGQAQGRAMELPIGPSLLRFP